MISLAHELFMSEYYTLTLSSHTYSENYYLNQKVFSEYLMPINKPTIKEQVEHMNLAKLPHIIDEVAQEREEISHIELFHHNGHIDAIWEMYTEAPRLTEKMTQMLSTF